jgi:ABC-type polysaccharide/polyol phosphate export permease
VLLPPPAAHGAASRVRQYAALVRSFVWNDVRTRYVGSGMGFFWTAVHPMLELAVYTLVFTVILRVRFDARFGTAVNSLFLFCGMIPWLAVQDSLSRGTTVVRDSAHLVKKLRFPPSVLPAYIVLSDGFNSLIRLAMLLVAAGFLGQGISWPALLALPVLGLQLLFTFGLSMLLATTQVYYKDTKHLLAPALMIWMFVTPIFYPPGLFPKEFAPLLMLNPLSHLVGIYRQVLLEATVPQWGSVVIFGAASALVFLLGAITFSRHSRRFPDFV